MEGFSSLAEPVLKYQLEEEKNNVNCIRMSRWKAVRMRTGWVLFIGKGKRKGECRVVFLNFHLFFFQTS